MWTARAVAMEILRKGGRFMLTWRNQASRELSEEATV